MTDTTVDTVSPDGASADTGVSPETTVTAGQVTEVGSPATTETATQAPADDKGEKPHWSVSRLSQMSARNREAQAAIAERDARIAEYERRLNPQPEGQQGQAPRQPTAADVDRLATERAEQIARQNEEARATAAWDEAGVKASPTFRADCQTLAHLGANENPAIVPALRDLDDSASVIARLAADPIEAERIFALSGHRAVLALAKFAAKAPTPPPVSRAPAPLTPVAGTARVEADPDKMSMEDYVKYRDGREAKRK